MLTIAELRALIHYDPDTGIITWRAREQNVGGFNAVHAGKPAGTVNRGYIEIKIKGKRYPAQRLAWFYMTGEWPPDETDHRDKDPGNNRFSNLRPASVSQNQANRKPSSNNTSGYKGVYRAGDCDRWKAAIRCRGKKYNLGLFKDREDAARAYIAAAEKLFGEFASDGRG